MKTNSIRSIAEAIADFWSGYVDPREDYFDEDGFPGGSPLADGVKEGGCLASINEAQLADIRGQCRALAMHNEFAINGHEKPNQLRRGQRGIRTRPSHAEADLRPRSCYMSRKT